MHAAAKQENINPHKVSIPGGYFAMVKCSQCAFQGFTSAHVRSHEASSHTVEDLPTFRLVASDAPPPYVPTPCNAPLPAIAPYVPSFRPGPSPTDTLTVSCANISLKDDQ